MKNKLLATLVFLIGAMGVTRAQLSNTSFESWAVNTNYLSLVIPAFSINIQDTAIANDPDNWTSTNVITAGKTFHNKTLCTQSNSPVYVGASALKVSTDSISATIGPQAIALNAPGFVVCGRFPIDLASFANLAGNFNPLTLPYAGVPVSSRKATIGGYLKYEPVGGDTAYVIAILRRGTTVVAEATFRHTGTDAAFVRFEVPFNYLNCLQPDTLVYAIASGNPYSYNNLISSTPTGLHIGSALYADSIFVSDTTASFTIVPTAVADSAHTVVNTPVSIPVTNNDISCIGGLAWGVTVSTAPLHGTAVVSGDSVVYTPANNYTGYDTLYYRVAAGTSAPSSPAMTRIRVAAPNAIIDLAEGQIKMYPNPANSKLYISTTNNAVSAVNIYDVLGKLVRTEAINTNVTVDLTGFNEGLYFARFTGSEGKVLSSSRFSVVK